MLQVPLTKIWASDKPWFNTNPVKAWCQVGESVINWSKMMHRTDAGHIKDQRTKSVKNMKAVVLQEPPPPPLNLIPHVSHQMWITKAKQIPDGHIEVTIARCKILGEGWTHILWVMDAEVLAPSIAKLKADLPALKVRQVYDYYLRKGEDSAAHPHKVKMYGRPLFDAMFDNNVFVVTTDVLRRNVVYKSSPDDEGGGLYSDMGIRLLVDITPLLNHAHMAFYVQPKTNIFDLGLSAYARGLAPLLQSLEILECPDAYEFGKGLWQQHGFLGSIMFQTYYGQVCGAFNTLPLVDGVHYSNEAHLSSMKERKGALGNQIFETIIKRKNSLCDGC
ncbi:MAG: hypothetical protein H6925_03495 [Holosporaceae bacterium]|nr:MAG: hypothetical protein H6925_03495 [Holosporaceae bacterium]